MVDVKHGLRLNAINARRVRGADGYYTLAMGIDVYRLIEAKVSELGLSSELVGNIALVKAKSWSSIDRLIKYARSMGINVIED